MRGEFAASIPRERSPESLRKSSNATSEGASHGLCFLVRQTNQHHEARVAFDEGGYVGAACAFQQVAFPMARHSSICDFGRALAN